MHVAIFHVRNTKGILATQYTNKHSLKTTASTGQIEGNAFHSSVISTQFREQTYEQIRIPAENYRSWTRRKSTIFN